MIKRNNNPIPYSQPNLGDSQGSLWSTFNCDFVSNPGKLRINRTRMVFDNTGDDSNSDGDFGLPIAITFFDDNSASPAFWIASSSTDSVGRMFIGGLTPNTIPTQDSKLNTPADISRIYSDMKVFNGNLYVTNSSEIHKLTGSSGAWSTLGTSLTASKPHLIEIYGGKMYITDNQTTIFPFDTSDAKGTTFDLTDSTKNFISWIRAGTNRIWIGTINQTGETSNIYEWDGASSQASRFYTINSPGSVACIILDNTPYVMDCDGRLLAFNGTAFVEVARLPVNRYRLLNATQINNNRFVHPNGMAIVDGRINILVNGVNNDSSSTINENLPSGVWEYEPGIGLYHKYAISYNSDTSSTITDWGQNRVERIGALFSANLQDWADATGITRNGKMMIGARIYAGSASPFAGLFIDDTNDTIQKKGYIVSAKIPPSQITDALKKVFITHKKFLNSTDKIELKYRTTEQDSTEFTVTWASTTSFTSTGDWSGYAIGDEVEIIQGVNGGATPHISNMSKVVVGATTTWTITVDETLATGSGSGKVRAQKWKKHPKSLSYTDALNWGELGGFAPDEFSWIELKICFTFTGKNEMDDLFLITEPKQKAL